MAYEFRLPDIGEGVIEGEIVRWLVKEGDVLASDQPMVEVMTDKATVEIPSPRAGVVQKRMFAEGQICPVGSVLITIDEGAGGTPSAGAGAASADASTAGPRGRGRRGSTAPGNAHSEPARASSPTIGPVLATPATRKLARELDVSLTSVKATGPNGRITSDDVRAAAGSGQATRLSHAVAPTRAAVSAEGDVRVPFRALRRAIAERMTMSKHKAAHFTYVEEVDATTLVHLREKANLRLAKQGLKLSFLPFFVRATVEALRRHPALNATLDEAAGEIIERRSYHIGIAAATAAGLVVPVVRDADRLSIVDLAREIDRLSRAAKDGKATRDELVGSTFTITSLGTLGGVMATPIINYPEVAILGIHKIAKRPVVHDDKIEIRDMMNLSLSVDHRVVDGHQAAAFVADIKEAIETPGLLFLESV